MSFFLNRESNRKSGNFSLSGKKRYQPNLVSLMALCANNYMLLLKVLADKSQVNEQRCFFISDALSYKINVDEVTRYTSLVTIEQSSTNTLLNESIAHILKPKMTVRLYHDARMVEVISSQDVRQVKPRYDYPNDQMHQQDEKQQINQFLNEWLHLCLDMGQVKVEFDY